MATFGRLTDMVNRGVNMDKKTLFFWVFNKERTKEFIIELNTQEQLFYGLNADGVILESIGGEYAESTVKRKRRKGQPTDRVTLKDTGAFYASFGVDVQGTEFTIEAYTMKGAQDLQDRWGNRLVGLNDDSIVWLVDFIMPDVKRFFLNVFLS